MTNGMDPIAAIQAQLQGMSAEQLEAFTKETGFNLDNLYLMNYNTAKAYCQSHNIDLKPTNVWAKYNKAKADWNTDHALYLQAKAQYSNLKDEITKAENKYNEMIAQFMEQNDTDTVSASDEASFRRKSKYTTDNIKSAKTAEMNADALLAKCYMDVDNQRAGLNFGMSMDLKG